MFSFFESMLLNSHLFWLLSNFTCEKFLLCSYLLFFSFDSVMSVWRLIDARRNTLLTQTACESKVCTFRNTLTSLVVKGTVFLLKNYAIWQRTLFLKSWPSIDFGCLPVFHLDREWSNTWAEEEQISFENLVFILKNYYRYGYKNVLINDLTDKKIQQLPNYLSHDAFSISNCDSDCEWWCNFEVTCSGTDTR